MERYICRAQKIFRVVKLFCMIGTIGDAKKMYTHFKKEKNGIKIVIVYIY